MTLVTTTGYLRPRSHPRTLHGAAWDSRIRSVQRLLEYGLLRDAEGRRLVPLDPAEAERRLKERIVEIDR